jgi:hypothetical protein
LGFATFIALIFSDFDPSTWGGGSNFLNFILFLTIFNASDAPIGGIQVLLAHQKQ